MMQDAIGSQGISDAQLKKVSPQLKKAHKAVHALLDSGEQGFITNLFDKKEEKRILQLAKTIQTQFTQVLIIGIGGSDLGARALQSFFPKEKGITLFFLGDTTDPVEINRICKQINWEKCAINAISKSGNTVEPLSVFLSIREKLMKKVGKKNHAKHVFITTESSESVFGQLAKENEYAHIVHPKNIGGRWTILSIVGLLSAAITGSDIKQLRKGAQEYYLQAKKQSHNSAMLYAALHYLHLQKGKSLAVLMPYTSQLDLLGSWYRQLFAESLGKEKTRMGKKVHTGLTPLSAHGPKDQHSQVQLYASGPFDKVITFIRIETDSLKTQLPALPQSHPASFLSKVSLHKILQVEQEATALALTKQKRATGTIRLKEVSEYSIGQLICFFELACVYLAELMDVNAFDQPGVEEGKNNMYALLGKPGYENTKKAIVNKQKTQKNYIS